MWGFAALVLSSDLILMIAGLIRTGRPSFRGSAASARALSAFTANVLTTQLIGFMARNLDNVLIGRAQGAAALGQYMLAYRIMRLPISSLVMVVNRALYPIYTSYGRDMHRLSRNFLEATRAMSVIVLPLMTYVVVYAPELILVAFGPDWDRAVLATRILAFAAMAQSLSSLMSPAMLATHRERAQLAWTVASTGHDRRLPSHGVEGHRICRRSVHSGHPRVLPRRRVSP